MSVARKTGASPASRSRPERRRSKLADARGTENYKAAADILADLREAIGGDEGEKIARKHAAHLAKKHPTLTRLKSSLRKRGLLK